MKPKTIVILLATLFSADLMANEIPYVFSAGNKAVASEVNENFEFLLSRSTDLSALIESLNVDIESDAKVLIELSDSVTALITEHDTLIDTVAANSNFITGITESLTLTDEAVLAASENYIELAQNLNELSSTTSGLIQGMSLIQSEFEDVNVTLESISANLNSTDEVVDEFAEKYQGIQQEISNILIITTANTTHNESTSENLSTLSDDISGLQDSIIIIEESLNDLGVGSVCHNNGLTDVGNYVSYIHAPTGAVAGDIVPLNDEGVIVFSLPYWSSLSLTSYSLTLPVSDVIVYNNDTASVPCSNTTISGFAANVTFSTNVEYKVTGVGNDTIQAIISSTVNAKIKDVSTVFDITFTVSNPVTLGKAADTSMFDMESALTLMRTNHEDELYIMLDNISLEATSPETSI